MKEVPGMLAGWSTRRFPGPVYLPDVFRLSGGVGRRVDQGERGQDGVTGEHGGVLLGESGECQQRDECDSGGENGEPLRTRTPHGPPPVDEDWRSKVSALS
jgi:hypothetical protein